MPVFPEVQRVRIREGDSPAIRFRVTNNAGNSLHSDGLAGRDVSAVTANVYDLSSSTPQTTLNSETATRTLTSVFTLKATPYSTEGWSLDATGWNMEDRIAVSELSSPWEAGHVYRVEWSITTDAASTLGSKSESPIQAVALIQVDALAGS